MRLTIFLLMLLTLTGCSGLEKILEEEGSAARNLPHIQTGKNNKHPLVGYKVTELYNRYGKPSFHIVTIEGKRVLAYNPEAAARGEDVMKNCVSAFTINRDNYIINYNCR